MSRELDNAVLSARREVTESLAVFRVAPRAGAFPPFEPGQFAYVGITPRDGGARVERAFSIASSAREREHLELYVRLVDDGAFTTELFALGPGAGLWVDGRVHGNFTLASIPAGSDLLMIGTGTGIAPFVSMLRTYRGTGRWGRCVLLESARTAAELGYRDELEQLAREDEGFRYRPTLTREPATSGWKGLRGRVLPWLEPGAFAALAEAPLEPAHWHVLLCGNPEMIVAVTAWLAERGFRRHRRSAPGQIHSERYW